MKTKSKLLACLFVSASLIVGAGCGRSDSEVVLYSSVDDYVLDEVVAAFEDETGIRVKLLGDTEATKTTGLVERLIAERDDPRADVWWSSEPFGTVRLAQVGVLGPSETVHEHDFDTGWPAPMKGFGWYGFAMRSRVIVYASDRLDAGDAPTTLAELTDARWSGRVGIAKPQFGTTRGHAAALAQRWGLEGFESWLTELEGNGLRVYDGNATVVRAVATGEIDVGLTDTDDVYAAQRNGWDVAIAPFPEDPTSGGGGGRGGGWAGVPFWIPNTAGLVRNGPNPANAQLLLDFILSADVERLIAETDSRNTPIRSPEGAAAMANEIDYIDVADHVPGAMAACERVLGP
jgi:iron(III) transport system substrate-binding protein